MNAVAMVAQCVAGQRDKRQSITAWDLCQRCEGTGLGLLGGWTCVACGGMGNVGRSVAVSTNGDTPPSPA